MAANALAMEALLPPPPSSLHSQSTHLPLLLYPSLSSSFGGSLREKYNIIDIYMGDGLDREMGKPRFIYIDRERGRGTKV